MGVEAIDFYKGYDDGWRWTRTAANNEIIAASTESYNHLTDCTENAVHINGPAGETHDGTVLVFRTQEHKRDYEKH